MSSPQTPQVDDQDREDALGQPLSGEQQEEQDEACRRGESERETGHRTDSPR